MIEYRPFLNSDAPLVAGIWRNQAPLRAVTPAVTAAVLEEHVFSKLYFDRCGLILAEEDGKLVGFVHAGFSPGESAASISPAVGLINLLMTVPRPDRLTIGRQLLCHAEQYLYGRGANAIRAGSIDPMGPFYLGLYGGSQLPGVMADDVSWLQVLSAANYQEIESRLVFQRAVSDFRPPIDRQMMQVRRQCQVNVERDPTPRSWWEACTTCNAQRIRFSLSSPNDDDFAAGATFWDIEPLASHWGVHAMGLLTFESTQAAQQQGWEPYLLAESLRQFQQEGITTVEVQASMNDSRRLKLLNQLGFEEVDRGVVFEKPARIT